MSAVQTGHKDHVVAISLYRIRSETERKTAHSARSPDRSEEDEPAAIVSSLGPGRPARNERFSASSAAAQLDF
jgi:hypothetical protein